MAGKAILLSAACILALATLCSAASITITPTSGFPDSLNGLNPGDVVTFQAATAGGSATYDFNGHPTAYTWTGTVDNPIIIQARTGDEIILTQTGSGVNLMEISGSYFVLRNFAITNGGATDPQVRLVNGASHAVIENNDFFYFNTNPLTANSGSVDFHNLTIRGNIIESTGGTGECVYMGQPGGVKAIGCTIEKNLCRNTCLYPCDGGSMGSGFQIKSGSYNNIIRDNVCSFTYGVCVLLYDDYDLGANLVEGNVIIDVRSDNAIQVSAGAVIRNNIIFATSPSSTGTHAIMVSANSLKSGTVNRNVAIVHNTIVNGVRGVNFASLTSESTGVSMINNVFLDNTEYDINVPDWSYLTAKKNGHNGVVTANAPSDAVVSLGTTSSILSDAANLNFYPTTTSTINAAGDPNPLAYDFNGYIRDGCTPTIGAYQYSTPTNPGWTITDGTSLKERIGPVPPCDLGHTCSTTIGCNGGTPTSANPEPPTTAPTGGSTPTGGAPTGGSTPTGGAPTGTPTTLGAPTPTNGASSLSPLCFGILAYLLLALF